MSDSYHYDEGANHYDNKKVLHLDKVQGADLKQLIHAFFNDDVEDAEVVDEKSSEEECPQLIDVLKSEKAKQLWIIARKAGWVDDTCQPLLSRTLSAVLADHMSTLLNIKNKWKVFEAFWHRNNMRGDYNDALNQKQYGEFLDKMQKMMPA